MVDQVVVLEWGCRDKQRVQHYPEQSETPDPSIQAQDHHFW
jgi:hypothetical protein